jgi:hypothetical protein
VVNPVGVATPTVGWKRAPLSAVASVAEVFLISVLLILHCNLYAVTCIYRPVDLYIYSCVVMSV